MDKNQELMQLMLIASLNSADIQKIINHNLSIYEKLGENLTCCSDKSVAELVVLLADKRKFSEQPDEIKKSMIKCDYYPDQLKTKDVVYADYRRSLCQELHNKVCAEYNIPATKIKVVDFKETELDHDMFEYYDPTTGVIFLNSQIDYSKCVNTELAERVLQATFRHQIYCEIKRNWKSLHELSAKQRYILLSEFVKRFAVSTLKDEKFKGVAKEVDYSDGFSSTGIYSVFVTYEYLNNLFTKHNLINNPLLEDFRTDRLSFVSSLTQKNETSSCEDFGELEGYDELDDFEKSLLEEDAIDEESLLYDALQYDLDNLNTLETSVLGQQTGGYIFNVLLSEMNDCADDFFDFFGGKLEDEFIELYKQREDLCLDQEDELN